MKSVPFARCQRRSGHKLPHPCSRSLRLASAIKNRVKQQGESASMMPQYRTRRSEIIVTIVLLIGTLLAVLLCYHIYIGTFSEDPPVFVCNSSHSPETDSWDGANTLVVYTGRWKFLRILFPYVYRELRRNGGVLDRVIFVMMNYDSETLDNLSRMTKIA